MRNVLITAATLIALAGSADADNVKMPNGTAKHTWFALNYRTATCDKSDQTPQEFFNYLNSPFGHMAGFEPHTISPTDVVKFGDDSIKVTIRTAKNGSDSYTFDFFSSKEMCDIYSKGVKPDQAPSGDIN